MLTRIKRLARTTTAVLGAILLMLSSAGAARAESVMLNGAGATFPYPLYSKWFFEFGKIHPDVKINYQSIGSGGGIKQITEGTVDFGATDAPMSEYELKKLKATILHIPTVLGAVVVTYNVPEVKEALKLSGDAVAAIYLGTIKKWNDPAVAALNPGVVLPDKDIVVVTRSDGSGTSFVFTDYLSKISRAWQMKVGAGKSVSWPAGVGAKGNEGVTSLVKQTPYAIGYVELGYAVQNNLPVASVRNKAGNFIAPGIQSISAAASGMNMPADYRVSLTDPPAKDAYPISSFTYLLVYKEQLNAAKGKTLVKFLEWAVRDAQKMAPPLYYAPLPDAVSQKVEQTISSISVP